MQYRITAKGYNFHVTDDTIEWDYKVDPVVTKIVGKVEMFDAFVKEAKEKLKNEKEDALW